MEKKLTRGLKAPSWPYLNTFYQFQQTPAEKSEFKDATVVAFFNRPDQQGKLVVR